jgi:MFS family permease
VNGFVTDLRVLAGRRSFLHVCAAGVFAAFSANFIMQYMASFLIRGHGLPLAEAATIVGLAGGVCGMLGAFFGGFLADRVCRRWPSARTLVAAAAFIVAAGAFAAAFHAPLGAAVPLLLVGALCMNCYPGISYAAASAVVQPAMRATAFAFFTLAGNLFGYAFGPPLLGKLSDVAAASTMRRSGVDPLFCASHALDAICLASRAAGLRLALTVASLLFLGGALHYWLASRSAARDRVE